MSTYTSQDVVAKFLQVKAQYSDSRVERFAADICPALTNSIPDAYTGLDPEVPEVIADDGSTVLIEYQQAGNERVTDVINTQVTNILGNGDYSKFAVQFFSARSYVSSVGEVIDSVSTVNNTLSVTFNSMDNLMTGNISGICLTIHDLGTDLQNTGTILDLSHLDEIGTPQSLIRVLAESNVLGLISEELTSQGVNPRVVSDRVIVEDLTLRPVIQKKCYDAFQSVTGEKLSVIKEVFQINNSNIETLADVLNPIKLLPTCSQDLISPTADGHRTIYANNLESVNSQFKGLGKDWYAVLPLDVADATAALRRSLQQIKGIESTNVSTLAQIALSIETGDGLADINALTTPIPPDTYSYYTSSFASGSGENGKYYLTDIIGTPTGVHHSELFESVNNTLSALTSQGVFDTIIEHYDRILTFLSGGYGSYNCDIEGSPPSPVYASIPGYGSYCDASTAVNAVLDGIETMITSFASSYPTEAVLLNTAFNEMCAAIETERTLQAKADIDFENTPSSETAVLSIVGNIHSYATATEENGAGWILERIADTGTRAGQALVGALREGRNLAKLAHAGIVADTMT